MIYKKIKKIAALVMMTCVISLAIFAGEQQQQDQKKDPPKIPVGNKERDRPNNNSRGDNRGNDSRNNDSGKPKKP